MAAPEEQEVLARYVGWGGLPQAFDEANEKWAAEYAELKELLTPEEYASARGSTLNAHYTSPTVIQSIYEAVGRMGIQPETVLEPAMGVGNFFGLLPETMQGATLLGVELDSITGRLAGQLYPRLRFWWTALNIPTCRITPLIWRWATCLLEIISCPIPAMTAKTC